MIYLTEWFQQQTEFTLMNLMFVEVLLLNQEERRKLLQEMNSLLSVRAAFDRHLKSPLYNKKISICEVFLLSPE